MSRVLEKSALTSNHLQRYSHQFFFSSSKQRLLFYSKFCMFLCFRTSNMKLFNIIALFALLACFLINEADAQAKKGLYLSFMINPKIISMTQRWIWKKKSLTNNTLNFAGKKNWFHKLGLSVQQCIYEAGAADPLVLDAITKCRKTKGGAPCLKQIPQVEGCFA